MQTFPLFTLLLEILDLKRVKAPEYRPYRTPFEHVLLTVASVELVKHALFGSLIFLISLLLRFLVESVCLELVEVAALIHILRISPIVLLICLSVVSIFLFLLLCCLECLFMLAFIPLLVLIVL